MASGQQRGEENLATFLSWMASKTDADFREMTTRGQLSRQEISRECGFARSVIAQNPRVKDALRELENGLRKRGVLPVAAETAEPTATLPSLATIHRAAADQAHLKRLESENAALRAEITKLRANLEHFRLMESLLAETGRLPR
ncbi:VPA1267 family protein [Paraburkholderia oxyphila]|uniref:VPA1267 family protein n=1 Tax=Paraburkholderia oxyphila TaxID=614212 RepID=UPI0004807110|nr:VPA1267 family protein [Paraburkholderia oxyphila]